MDKQQIAEFATELKQNLTENILPYWLDTMADEAGGYYGRRDGTDMLYPDAVRGTILNARILWTMSAAAIFTGRDDYAVAAQRQYRYFISHFIDTVYGGCYWSVNPDGTPSDTKKQFYAIAFAIYGLTEYYRLTGDNHALDVSIELFRIIEHYSRDRVKGGYFEAMTRDWKAIDDMRLSDKDMNSSKTMNTHLHILEAYTNLLRVWPSEECREATVTLLELFNNRIVCRPDWHLGLFFDDDMKRVDCDISYGHDIEASWLMLEAARVIGDDSLIRHTMEITANVAHAALEGRCADGSMIYELDGSGHHDSEKHWWVQAENVVGQIYLAAYHGEAAALDMARESWDYINNNLVDHMSGEWHWSRLADGSINRVDDKAGFWKCPYHNSRMCIEAATTLRGIV